MPSAESYSYAFGPLMAFVALGIIVLLMRWAFAHGQSLVERPARPGAADTYGLLVAVAAPTTYVEAEMARQALEDAGLRATLARTTDGPRIMVFQRDEVAARRLLAAR